MATTDAVARSRLQLLEFLVQALADTPTEEFVRGLFADEGSLPDAEVNEPLDEGLAHLRSFYEANRDRDLDAVWRDVITEHAQLYLGGNPRVPSTESAYRDGVEPDDVAARYEAAGWSAPGDDPPDDIAVELAYLGELVTRQRDDAAAFERERAFLDDHLLRWADDFAEATYERADSDLYRGVASVLLGATTFEAAFVAERAPD